MVEPRQNTTNAVRVLILLALAMAGAVVTGIIGFVMTAMKVDIMWTIVLQDVLMFILPAILLAVICYKRPWRFLEIDRPPSWLALVIVVVVWAVSMPAMNWLVEWNQNIHLPASMAALEQTLRDSEDAMEQITNQLLTLNSVGDLVAGILVVGVMAGVSEEFFFRGALFGIMRRGRANIHIVIWTVAIVFSAIHFQFFGFVPRMLLGAWFGYLLVWTRSLWVPVIAHALNNGIVVVFQWLDSNHYIDGNALDQLGVPAEGQFPVLALASAIATILLIVAAKRVFSKKIGQNA